MVIDFGLESGESLNTGIALEREEREGESCQEEGTPLLPPPHPHPHPRQGAEQVLWGTLSQATHSAQQARQAQQADDSTEYSIPAGSPRKLVTLRPAVSSVHVERKGVGWVLRASGSSSQAFVDPSPPTPRSLTDSP